MKGSCLAAMASFALAVSGVSTSRAQQSASRPAARGEAPAVPLTPPSIDAEAAESSFKAGEKAFDEGAYESALAAFERAFALVRHDAIRFNIAVCLEKLGRHVDALAQYDATAKSPILSAADRERARTAAAAMRSRLGALVVETDAGSSIVVDGVARCSAPCRVDVEPGSHDVVVQSQARSRRLRVMLQAGQEVALQPEERAPPPTPPAPPERAQNTGPGWMTWGGAAFAAVGTAGIVGFGLRAQALHDEYVAAPTQKRRDEGMLARGVANASIGVAAAGAAMIAIDVIFFAPKPRAQALPARGAISRKAVSWSW